MRYYDTEFSTGYIDVAIIIHSYDVFFLDDDDDDDDDNDDKDTAHDNLSE